MLFNSLKFLIFFPVVFLLYWGVPQRFRKILLLAASYYFYMSWKPEFIALVLLSTIVDYACGLGMERWPRGKRLLLAVSLTVNLGLLFFFKYFNFFGETVTAFCRAISIPFSAPVLDVILPVGISFYTFQTLSYTIDVYRGKQKPQHDFILFALFVSYFPQLVAGPIERAENLMPQLKAPHAFCYEDAAWGLRLMVWGFFKKCVAAAYLAKLVDPVFENVGAYSGGAVALAHFSDRMVSGICVHTPRRQPKGLLAQAVQYLDRLFSQRFVARGQLDVCCMGLAPGALHQYGTDLAAAIWDRGEQALQYLL